MEGQTLRPLGGLHDRPDGLPAAAGLIRPCDARTDTERWMRDGSGSVPVGLDTAHSTALRADFGVALLPGFCVED